MILKKIEEREKMNLWISKLNQKRNDQFKEGSLYKFQPDLRSFINDQKPKNFMKINQLMMMNKNF